MRPNWLVPRPATGIFWPLAGMGLVMSAPPSSAAGTRSGIRAAAPESMPSFKNSRREPGPAGSVTAISRGGDPGSIGTGGRATPEAYRRPPRPAGFPPRPRSRWGTLFLARVVPDGLDVVAVGIEYEGCVVSGRVVAISRAAVVLAAGRQACAIKCLDLLLAGGLEGHVHRDYRAGLADPQVGVLAVVEACGFVELHVVVIPERRQRCDVERLGLLVVADRQ